MATITIGGFAIAVEATEQVRTTTGALYTKAIQKTYDDDKKGKLDLLKLVQSKQQQPYATTSISVNDPEKLLNHYSLSKLNKECNRNLNSFHVTAPTLAPLLGVLFFGGISPTKIGLSAPSLERAQLRFKAHVFLYT
jgi:hypothetical protein